MSTKKPNTLRTVDEIAEAHEELFAKQRDGKIDPKTADAMNTTLKGIVYLQVKMRMEMFKLVIQSQMKKLEIPEALKRSLPIAVE